MPVRISENSENLARECLDWLIDEIDVHQRQSECPFALALSGGSTPKLLYALFGDPVHASRIDWSRVLLLWGDERSVPSDHVDSNYRMVAESLLGQIDIPPENVLAVPNPGDDASVAAQEYEAILRRRLPQTEDGWPIIDCVLLGLGDDAHTASLFPYTDALEEKVRWVVANYVPKLNTWRITLTAPAINSARKVAFLISGSSKTQALDHLWNGPQDYKQYPSQLIRPASGALDFYVDKAAVGKLLN